MSYVVMKCLGDQVTLVCEQAFATRQQALEELGTALAGASEDAEAEYVVFDLDAASPVLLLPVEVEEASEAEMPQIGLVEEIVVEEVPAFLEDFDGTVLVEPAEPFLVEVVTTEPASDVFVEELVLPDEFAEEVIVEDTLLEDIVLEDVLVEETPEEAPAQEPAVESTANQGPDDEVEEESADQRAEQPAAEIQEQETSVEAAAEDLQASTRADEDSAEESTGVETVILEAERLSFEEVEAPDTGTVNLALDELLPVIDLGTPPEPEPKAEAPAPEAESTLAPAPVSEPEPALNVEPAEEPQPESEPAPEPEPEMPGYEAGDSDLSTLTCEDCVYVTTCPNKEERMPSACGSFQWVSV